MKTCSMCAVSKPLTEFNKNKSKPDGLQEGCRPCTRKYNREWAEKARRAKGVLPMVTLTEDEKRQRRRVKAHKRRKHYSYGDFSAADWNALIEAYGPVCMKCGSKDDLSLDHVVPLSLYGEHSLRNAQILCLDCNRSKGNRTCTDYRPFLAFEEQDWQKHEVPMGLNPLAAVL